MTVAADLLSDLVKPGRLTSIVDIGANPLSSDGEPPYKKMLDKRLCTLAGFEPQPDALAKLDAQKGDLETYLPYAVGNGAAATLKVCAARGMSSLLTPDPRMLRCFPGFMDYGNVIQEIPVQTRTLDSISEIAHLDFLKIDVQGEELTVFRNGKLKLSEAVAIQCEVSFVPFYKDQPVYGDIDLALRDMGFIPHALANLNKRMILPLHFQDQPFASINQIIEADMVYVRDFTRAELMTDEQLKHLALIAHHCYASIDLAIRCLHDLAERAAIPQDAVGRYLAQIKLG